MHLKVGTPGSFIFKSKENNDVVSATIKDLKNNKYFNGIFWVEDEVSIYVNEFNGVFNLKFAPDRESEFLICLKSSKTEDVMKYNVTSSSNSFNEIIWSIDETFERFLSIDNPSVEVICLENNKYYTGEEWVDDEVLVNLNPHLSINFEFLGNHSVKIFSDDVLVEEFRITVKEPDLAPIKVSNLTIKNTDGSCTTLVDSINNLPIIGAKISAYSMKTKELVSVTQSDEEGNWAMYIKSGNYIFLFEKDGYLSKSLERAVR